MSPSFEEIGKLGAIATIRTALNYFLGRELQEEAERAEQAERHDARGSAADRRDDR